MLSILNRLSSHLNAERRTSQLARLVAALGLALAALSAHAAIPESERAVLLALYSGTNGANWTIKTNWVDANGAPGAPGTECTWYGITCNADQSHVTEIRMFGNNLAGTLPVTLNDLRSLRSLELTNNQLTGSIPSLAGLTALQDFFADNNRLEGTIPSLTELVALRYFYASRNQLTGSIPSLTELRALREFSVRNNRLTGTLPSLAGMNELLQFVAGFNQLRGAIPPLTGLTELVRFDVYGNQLTGLIPLLTEVPALQYFAVGYNQLTGTIPELTGLTALLEFQANENQLTGPIPSLEGLSNLQIFRVETNQLSGTIPAVPSPNGLLNGLSDLCHNQLTVSADPAWDAATSGATWDIGCITARPNQTLSFGPPPRLVAGGSGTVSATASSPSSALPIVFASLTPAVCSVNAATGLISVLPNAAVGNQCTISADKAGDDSANSAPQVRLNIAITAAVSIPASERAVLLALYSGTNGANWTIKTNWVDNTGAPSAPGTECTWYRITCNADQSHVTEIRLFANNLVGTLPVTLNQLRSLREFDVIQNQLSGTLPSLTGLTALEEFYAYGNELNGAIPSLTGLTALRNVDVSNNRLTGAIPSLTGLTALREFYVSQNQLSGVIPELTGLTALEEFGAGYNLLTGSIPELSGLTALQYLYVNNNQLTGSIPLLDGLTALQEFYVHANQLTGVIPSLAGLINLRRFRVENNQLTGVIPAVPAPTSVLLVGLSDLCPNQLTVSVNAAWDTATPGDTWDIGCIAARPNQTLDFGPPPRLVAGGSGTVSATASSPSSALPIVFASLTPAVCSVDATTGLISVLPNAAVGNQCTISADKAGDDRANSAPQVRLNIAINAAAANATAVPTLGGLGVLALAGFIALLGGIAGTTRRHHAEH
jgi:Leucine-rich repeat (LRR) protein